MQKLILSLGFGVLFIGATQAQTPSSSVPSDTEISLQEERRNAYQQQSITGITNRKDQLYIPFVVVVVHLTMHHDLQLISSFHYNMDSLDTHSHILA